MAKTKTRPWDAASHLKTEASMVAYLEAAFEDGDAAVVAAALGDIARAKGMAKIAERAGLGRESLYKALSRNGNPELATVLRVVRALGLRLHVAPAQLDEAIARQRLRQIKHRGSVPLEEVMARYKHQR